MKWDFCGWLSKARKANISVGAKADGGEVNISFAVTGGFARRGLRSRTGVSRIPVFGGKKNLAVKQVIRRIVGYTDGGRSPIERFGITLSHGSMSFERVIFHFTLYAWQ